MTMDLFAPKKSALLILSLAAGFWYVGCSSTPASTPPNGGGRSNVGGGSHSNAGGSGQGGNTNAGYQFSGGATSVTSGTGTNKCAGNNCSAVDAGPFCGDKVIRTDLDENCDDGNRVGGDGCSGICRKRRIGNAPRQENPANR
jgi:cysteine-rich repeat protein